MSDELFINAVERTYDSLIRYLRLAQKEYIEKDRAISGVEEMDLMIQKGFLKMSTYIKILPIIQDYNSDYDLIVLGLESKSDELKEIKFGQTAINEKPDCDHPQDELINTNGYRVLCLKCRNNIN